MDAVDLCMMGAELVEGLTLQHGDDVNIRIALMVVEVDGISTPIELWGGEDRDWVKRAFLDEAVDAACENLDTADVEDDD